MTFLLVMLLILAATVSTAHLLRCSFETALPTALFSMTLLLYGFGVVNLLSVGFAFVLVLVFGGALVALVRLIRAKGLLEEMKRLATPGIAIFGAFFLVTFFLSRRLQLSSWDEFSHWGTIIRATSIHGALGPYNPVDLIFPDYPPSVGLFQYMVMKLSGGWLEGNLFWGYQILFGSLFIPFMNRLTWRPVGRILLIVPLVALTPVLFFPAFSVILVDPLLGFLFGYVLALAYTGDLRDWRLGVHLSLGLAMLVLAKDAGIVFALIAVALYLGRLVAHRVRSTPQVSWREVWARFALPIVASAVAWFSWSLLLSVREVPRHFASPIRLGDLADVLAGDGAAYQQTVVTAFSHALTNRPLTERFAQLNHLHWLVILVVFVVLLDRLVVRRWSDRFGWTTASTVVIGAVLYTTGLFVSYLFRFSEYEAVRLASYGRYLSTYWAGIALFMSLSIIWMLSDRNRFSSLSVTWSFSDEVGGATSAPIGKTGTASLATSLSVIWLVLLLLLAPFGMFRTLLLHPTEYSEQIRAPLRPIVSEAREVGIEAGDSIWIIAEHTTGFQYLILRYSLMDLRVNTGSQWSLGNPKDESDIWTVSLSVDEFATALKDHEYLLVYSTNASFAEPYRELFSNPSDLQNSTIFEVTEESGQVSLVKVGG